MLQEKVDSLKTKCVERISLNLPDLSFPDWRLMGIRKAFKAKVLLYYFFWSKKFESVM